MIKIAILDDWQDAAPSYADWSPLASRADLTFFADPLEFRPERWLGVRDGPHNVSAHTPFGSGPRLCPGRSLALIEMNALLSMLYKAFDVERVGDSQAVSERFGFTMSPAGLRVCLHPRPRKPPLSERCAVVGQSGPHSAGASRDVPRPRNCSASSVLVLWRPKNFPSRHAIDV